MLQGSWSLRLSCSCKLALQNFALKHGRASASVFVPLSCIKDKLRLQVLSQDVEVARYRSRHVPKISPRRKADEDGRWLCSGCGEWLQAECFHREQARSNALRPRCRTCVQLYSVEYRQTLRGFLLYALNNAKKRSLLNGRAYEIVLDNVLDSVLQQQGRCAYSGAVLSMRPLSDWQCTLE